MKNNINIREEVKEFIRDYGTKVLYQKSSQYIKCNCVDYLTSSPDNKCDICNGSGKVIKSKVMNIMFEESFRSGGIEKTIVGDNYNKFANIYIDYNNKPLCNDTIYIVGWNKNKMINVYTVYNIDRYTPILGDNGRTEYYILNCSNKPEKIDHAQKYINSLRGNPL